MKIILLTSVSKVSNIPCRQYNFWMDSKFAVLPFVSIYSSYYGSFCQEMFPGRVQCKHCQQSSTEDKCPQYILLHPSGTF